MKPQNLLFTVTILAALAWAGSSVPGATSAQTPTVKPSTSSAPGKRALLIGVTNYPNVEERFHLDGPANDLKLMTALLQKYEFPLENIHILSEELGQKDGMKFPTRANIEREMKYIAEAAQKGDQVVIFMSGHGSRQPEAKGDPQPDGLEKLFLPRDIQKWDPSQHSVANSITGGEIRQWLSPIPQKGASLWVLVDSCHSGGICRGADERERQMPSEALSIPDEAVQKAEQAAAARQADEKHKGFGASSASPLRLAQQPGVVVFYACHGFETTVEKKFPVDKKETGGPEKEYFGLMTYTMNRILGQAQTPMTYRDLARRIQQEYAAMPRTSPTMFVEGEAQDRILLGLTEIKRDTDYIVAKRAGNLAVDGGELRGLTAGSVLAVYPPAGAANPEKGLGHIRVTKVEMNRSFVEPCEFEKVAKPDPATLMNGRAKVVFTDFGDMRLRVTLDPNDNHGKPLPAAVKQELTALLVNLSSNKLSMVRYVAEMHTAREQDQPNWLLRYGDGNVQLIPWSEYTTSKETIQRKDKEVKSTALAPVALDKALEKELESRLRRIARSENLKKLAVRLNTPAGTDLAPQVKLEVLKEGKPVQEPLELKVGEKLTYRITNTGRVSVDVTVLYIDSAFGITSLIPFSGEANRVAPGGKIDSFSFDVSDDTLGQENIVVIALESNLQGQPVNLAEFAQPAIQQETKRGGSSPLGQLLEAAMDGKETSRGPTRSTASSTYMSLTPVMVRR